MGEWDWERLPTEAQLALQTGRRADAVAIVRAQTGLGMVEARELVARAERSSRQERLDVPRAALGREDSGVLRLVVIMALLGAVALAVLYAAGGAG